MRNWSDSPFEREVSLESVSHYSDSDVIARDNGESSVIYALPDHPDWVVKRYRSEVRIDRNTLTRLIGLPAEMPSHDLGIVDRSAAWPVAVVMSGYRVVGVIMRKAPQEFFWDIELIGGRTRTKNVDVDLLVNSAERMLKMGLPVPSNDAKFASLREIVAVAELFERYNVVYGDWSFANAFWSPKTQRILVIDMDTSGIGTGPRVQSPNWDDPLVLPGQPLTVYADRYKVALLVARAVTGERTGRLEAVDALERIHPRHRGLADLFRKSLTATRAEQRPSLTDLLNAMDSSTAGASTGSANVTGVKAWNPRERPEKTRHPSSPAWPRPSTVPQAAPHLRNHPTQPRRTTAPPSTNRIQFSRSNAEPVRPRPDPANTMAWEQAIRKVVRAFVACAILGWVAFILIAFIHAVVT